MLALRMNGNIQYLETTNCNIIWVAGEEYMRVVCGLGELFAQPIQARRGIEVII